MQTESLKDVQHRIEQFIGTESEAEIIFTLGCSAGVLLAKVFEEKKEDILENDLIDFSRVLYNYLAQNDLLEWFFTNETVSLAWLQLTNEFPALAIAFTSNQKPKFQE